MFAGVFVAMLAGCDSARIDKLEKQNQEILAERHRQEALKSGLVAMYAMSMHAPSGVSRTIIITLQRFQVSTREPSTAATGREPARHYLY